MGDEAYWREGEPRVIRSGRWEQDELGDISYIPDHVRPVLDDDDPDDRPDPGHSPDPDGSPDPAQTAGYRVRSDAVWAAARRDYLAGDTAEAVCDRYQLKSGTLRARAAREGWRRSDMEDVWPAPDDEDDDHPGAAPPDLTQMAAQALMRLDRAVRRGRAAEAASWLRTWRALTDPALLAPLTPEPAPDPAATLEADLKAVAEVARDAAALAPHDHAGRLAIEARMAALKARLDPDGKISDQLDELDSVFPGEEADPP
uniref:Terminase small subunit n=1 Tax=Parastrongyloides trichosuri TaxID=131310 RepID=A0A0N4ZJL4_PARTI